MSTNEQGTLYQNAIVWSCESLLVNIEWMWILSRDRVIPDATYATLLQKAKDITGYDVTKLITTVQTGCASPLSKTVVEGPVPQGRPLVSQFKNNKNKK